MLDLLLFTICNLIYNLYKIKSRRLCPQKVCTEEYVFQNRGVPCNYRVRELVWHAGVTICGCLLVVSVRLLVVCSRLFVVCGGLWCLWSFSGVLWLFAGSLGSFLAFSGCLWLFAGGLWLFVVICWWFVFVCWWFVVVFGCCLF